MKQFVRSLSWRMKTAGRDTWEAIWAFSFHLTKIFGFWEQIHLFASQLINSAILALLCAQVKCFHLVCLQVKWESLIVIVIPGVIVVIVSRFISLACTFYNAFLVKCFLHTTVKILSSLAGSLICAHGVLWIQCSIDCEPHRGHCNAVQSEHTESLSMGCCWCW